MTLNKYFYSLELQLAAISRSRAAVLLSFLALSVLVPGELRAAQKAPEWMHVAATRALPSYDVKTDAVLVYSDTTITVLSRDKIRTRVREAYKIVRPQARYHGEVAVYTYGRKKVTFMRGWCIPANGKDYEVLDRDAVEQSPQADGYNLVSDLRRKLMRIPAPDPGNTIGYEYEIEENPFYLQEEWEFQGSDPVRESHFRLELPEGWSYRSSWINHAEISPSKTGSNTWEWSFADVPKIEDESQMPPFQGLAGKMIISLLPPGGAREYGEFTTWNDMGLWYGNLVGELDASSVPIKDAVASFTASGGNPLAKMQAIAEFMQREVRYVAIELGIGGFQPHSASDVFSNRYGDCKDKATLTIAMMRAIGIDAYFVIINARRGAVNGTDPAHNGFNHAITAIRLPEDVQDPSLVATLNHPKLGRILFFDPTDEVTPFGRIRGQLQSNFGLLIGPNGGELIQLPRQVPALSGIRRFAQLTLTADGTLQGQVVENRIGDQAVQERMRLRAATTESDKVKPLEALLSDSLGTFLMSKPQFSSVVDRDKPIQVVYAFRASGYARTTGDLLLLRPRVLGSKSSGLLETNEPRLLPVEFPNPELDSDDFEITLPPGYSVVDLAPPVNADFGFASYHSRIEIKANTLRYLRTFEVRDLTVPANKAAELKRFYRIIATDERGTVVLRRNAVGAQ